MKSYELPHIVLKQQRKGQGPFAVWHYLLSHHSSQISLSELVFVFMLLHVSQLKNMLLL
jgi:hypothetical protein